VSVTNPLPDEIRDRVARLDAPRRLQVLREAGNSRYWLDTLWRIKEGDLSFADWLPVRQLLACSLEYLDREVPLHWALELLLNEVLRPWGTPSGRRWSGDQWEEYALELREQANRFLAELREVAEAAGATVSVADERPATPTVAYCLLPPNLVRWKNQPVELRRQLWRLLRYLLSRDDYPLPAHAVQFEIWGSNPPTPHHFTNTIGLLNNALEPVAFPWTWRVRGEAVERD
jgi:hypothetical protein